MRRREVLALVWGMAAFPRAVRAQERGQIVGFLSSGSAKGYVEFLAAFRDGLRSLGYAEGRNLLVEARWADSSSAQLPALAQDLASRKVKLIATTGIGSALAAKAASSTIPILFVSGDDPVRFGLVASFSRPGGNVTGINLLTASLVAKRLDLANLLAPPPQLVAFLINPSSPEAQPQLTDLRAAAQTSGRQITVVTASDEAGLESAFAALAQQGASALLISNDPFYNSNRDRLVELAARHRLPSIFDRREYVAAGGLISYGVDYPAAYREMGLYAGKILNGADPADLPVQQPTRFQLVLNLKAARALGLLMPPTILAQVDEVIE